MEVRFESGDWGENINQEKDGGTAKGAQDFFVSGGGGYERGGRWNHIKSGSAYPGTGWTAPPTRDYGYGIGNRRVTCGWGGAWGGYDYFEGTVIGEGKSPPYCLMF